MATSTEIKQRANTLAEKTDVNSITPKEVGGIMYDLASHGENVLRNGGTLGIRKVYESVAAMEADSTNPKDFWGDPIKKGNLVVIYDGTTTGVDNNKIYAFMKPGWELATKLDAAYATKAETDAKLSELGSEVGRLLKGYIHGNGSTKFYSPNDNGKYLTYIQSVTPGEKYIIYMDALIDNNSLAAFTADVDYLNASKSETNLSLVVGYNEVTVPQGMKFLGVTLEFDGTGDRTKKIIAKAPLYGIVSKVEDIEENLKVLNLIPSEIEDLKKVESNFGENIFINIGLVRKDGRIVESADWRYSDYMLITGTSIRMKVQNWASSSNYATIVFYNHAKEVVGYIDSEDSALKEVEITETDIPENAKYYVVSVKATEIRQAYIKDWIVKNLTYVDKKIKNVEDEVASNSEFRDLFKKEETINSIEETDGYYRNYGDSYKFVRSSGYKVSTLLPINIGDEFFVGTSIVSNASSTSCHVIADKDGNLIGLLESDTNNLTTYKITKQIYNKGARFVAFSFKESDEKTIIKSYYKKEIKSEVLYDKIHVNDVYRGMASEAIKDKLLVMSKDIDIVLDGDSLTAFTNIGKEMLNAANLPPGCQRNCITYMLWDSLCKNKQQCDRFDSQVNVFIENGTFQLSDVSKQNTSGNTGTEKGEFNADGCVYRETSTTGDYVQFEWNLADYEKLNFIYRMGYDATTEVTIQCTSGMAEVYDRISRTWVEASGYTFRQYKEPGSKFDGRADWLRNLPLKFRRKSEIGIVTLKVVNSGSGVMYYWGTERWNFNTVRVTNIARGGRHIQHLQGVLTDEINYRDIDYFIIQLPIWNEMKSGGYYNEVWDSRHIAFLDKLKELSNDFKDFQVAVTLYHTQKQCWDGNRNLVFLANGESNRTPTNELEWDGIMRTYKAVKNYGNDNVITLPLYLDLYNFAQSIGLTMSELLSSDSDSGIGDGTSVESGEVYDKFTVDGAHCSNAGFKFYNTLLRSIFFYS